MFAQWEMYIAPTYTSYPLVNLQKKELMENPPFFMGKSTINGHVE